MNVKEVAEFLKSSALSVEDKNLLINVLLERLNAFPATSIIQQRNDGRLLINGQLVDVEKARQLREGALSLLQSSVRKLIKDQVAFIAVKKGVHEGVSPESIMFSKVAIWWSNEEDELLKLLVPHEEVNAEE